MKEQLKKLEQRNAEKTTQIFQEQILGQFLSKEPNAYHEDIILSNYPIILTTNYDDLLFKAAKKLSVKEYLYSVFDFNQPEEIANKLYFKEPFIFHIHGKARIYDGSFKFDNIILTKDDYQKIRKDRPAFSQLLRSIFLQNTVLFVGYGANDPHLNDVFEEMSYLFPENSLTNRHYVVWKKDANFSKIQSEYNKLNRLQFITIDDYSEYSTLFSYLKF